MLAEMLRSCAYRVGLYTSPHILDVRERIVVDGELITPSAFMKVIAAVARSAEKLRLANPTYFEIMTAAALLYFEQADVDIAVVETGLGGRLDCTNVVRPEVVGITSISYDHQAFLGSTLPAIAREKAGIIKDGIPVVSAPQRPEVAAVLKGVADAHNSPLRVADEESGFSCRFEFSRAIGRHTRICLVTPTSRFEHLHVPLLGEHQAINCGVALHMLDALKGRGLVIDDQKAMEGLSRVRLPGRMELICEDPRVLVDGAHNGASVDALMRAIGQNISYDSMVVIFGCQRHKDVSGMLRRLQLGADKIVFTRIDSAQSADPAELAAEYVEHCGKIAQVAQNFEDAVSIARRAVTRGDLVCVAGSFLLVAEAKRLFSA
jgi:dihydrofolate synthase/folylpolyglutamate synthase